MDRPVKTFSIGFSEQAFNEASDAEIVAKHLGTDHTALMLAPSEARRMIPELLTHFDEPFADSSALPTYFVSELARREVTVALSGDGGDELFGGYPWRQLRPAYQRALSSLPQGVRTAISRASRLLPARLPGANFLRRMDIPYARYVLDAQAVFDEQDRVGLYSRHTAAALAGRDPYAHHLPHLDTATRRPWPSRMMQYDLKTYLPNDILTKVDRMSMYVSLEAREPLLDHKLVELAAKIPWDLKLRSGISKYILKQVIRPMLPPEVLQKRKQGFSIPLDGWLRTDLRTEVLETLRAGNRHGLFDRRGLDAVIDDFYAGNDRRNHQIWTLYAFEHWYRTVHEAAAFAPMEATCRA
jgi:asparagine synthase (glutamine-hydrolysing)